MSSLYFGLNISCLSVSKVYPSTDVDLRNSAKVGIFPKLVLSVAEFGVQIFCGIPVKKTSQNYRRNIGTAKKIIQEGFNT
jgi:hypothetical protein